MRNLVAFWDFSRTFEMTLGLSFRRSAATEKSILRKRISLKMLSPYYVYIVTNEKKTVLYIGVTNNIQNRLSQHYFDSQNTKKSFAGKYNCYHLLYYEQFDVAELAIAREKELKKWRREKKEKLITSFNPNWEFLNHQVV